jgi:hypothetical protein
MMKPVSSVVQTQVRSPYHATAQGMSLMTNSSSDIQPEISRTYGG